MALTNTLSFASLGLTANHGRRSVLIYVGFVVVLALWRYATSDVFDPYKCNSLLSSGTWLDGNNPKGPSTWQPDGCLFHTYNSKEASTCLNNQYVLFTGDSTVRQLFWDTVRTIDPAVKETKEKHSDIRFVKNSLSIEFLWDPYLNSTGLKRVASCAKVKHDRDNAFVVLGSGLWFARYLGDDGITSWKDSTDRIVKDLQACTDHYQLPFFLPVSVPSWNKLDPARSSTILKSEVDYMNSYLQWLSHNSSIVVPTSINAMMAQSSTASDESGIHAVASVSKAKANVLLNMRCNLQVTQANGYPFDKTCCFKYPLPNFVQWVFLIVTCLVVPLLYLKSAGLLTYPSRWPDSGAFFVTGNALVTAAFIFSSTLAYSYFADRTSLFNKAAKQFLTSEFTILSLLSLLAGIFTIQKSDSEQGFMGRDQSNEWKGWMQIAVLIYHICGASKVLPIYKFVRVLVAAYLFMTGYGHTVFFYKKNDFSLKRVANVLVRLNLLSCALAYIMDTDYLFYYFAPLSSFWFIIVYLTMIVKSSKNKDLKFLITKIALSGILTHYFLAQPGILESIWFLLERVFFISWDLREWRFRVLLDGWIVFVGMLGGIALIKVQELRLTSHQDWRAYRVLTLIASVIALVIYHALSKFWNSKQDYNAHHPYISFLPIVGFLFLRNATARLRNTYSTAFAWVGSCSLETFTLQFHIWMAADTHGVLQLVSSSHRVINFIILTPLFLYMSYLTADATGRLTSLIVNGVPAAKSSVVATAKPSLPVTETGPDNDKIAQVSVRQVEESHQTANLISPLQTPSTENPPVIATTNTDVQSQQQQLQLQLQLQENPSSTGILDVEKGAFGSNGNTTAVVADRYFPLARLTYQNRFVRASVPHFSDMRIRLLSILIVMWAINVAVAFAKKI
ncbi:10 TM acyl transferase domain found in Cas1p-domain-containing protein [Lipomyces japonicus]|uniref:10 TM acyl transferase domain found in Cas1p-domain-containing protein n=1 Tax=Lipomyces japonicus TaxID=56871 RepID=UPI0034CE9AE8